MPVTGEALLDAVLTLVGCGEPGGASQAANDSAVAWQSGEFGGFEAYVEADVDEESAEARAVFSLDDESEPLVQNLLVHNTLNLVMRDSGVLRFVKYVHAAAPGSRVDVSAEYGLQRMDVNGRAPTDERSGWAPTDGLRRMDALAE